METIAVDIHLVEKEIRDSIRCKIVQDNPTEVGVEFVRDFYVSNKSFYYLQEVIGDFLNNYRTIGITDKLLKAFEKRVNSILLEIYDAGELYLNEWPGSDKSYIHLKKSITDKV